MENGDLRDQFLLVGFALETENEKANAEKKLVEKNLDMIVINNIKSEKTGFACDTNQVTLLERSGTKKELPLLSKDETAKRILDEILSLPVAP